MLKREELKELLAKCTPGKWEKDKYAFLRGIHNKQIDVWSLGVAFAQRNIETESNAKLMALAPDLARRVIALEEVLQEAVGLVNSFGNPPTISQTLKINALNEKSKKLLEEE